MTRTIENHEGTLPNRENAFRLVSFLQNYGIKRVIFDFDDTLVETIGVFDSHITRMLSHLALNNPGLDPQLIRQSFEVANNRNFEAFGVSSDRWSQVLTDMSLELGFTPADQEFALAILKDIYQTPIPPVPYALETLDLLKTANIDMGIVTHADSSWTERKFHGLNLGRVMSLDHVFCIDTRGHKTADRWIEAFSYFCLLPSEVMVVGDSLRSDIYPTLEAGVAHVVWIQGINTWSAHQRNIPQDSRMTIVNSIKDLLLLGNEAPIDLPQPRTYLPTSFA